MIKKATLNWSIEPAEIKIKKLKLNFVKRILENEFTNRIFKSVKTESGLTNTFVKEAYELINIDVGNEITNADVKKATKNLTMREKAECENGICDSIRICLEKMEEREDMLHMLIKAF